MCFVDALVVDGEYLPALVGRYLGGLLPAPDVRVLGAVSALPQDPLSARAIELGRRVAGVLGTDGRFATHLEFFDHPEGPLVLEVCARAPGALVSEMARAVCGINLETAHLAVQAGQPAPPRSPTGRHAAWLSILAHPDQTYHGPPPVDSDLITHQLPAPAPTTGRYVAALTLLTHTDHDHLSSDVRACRDHPWFT